MKSVVQARSGGVQPGAGAKCPVQFGSLNGHEDYSSVFASPPRNLPAAKAPAAPHPSILGPPFVPPPAQPQPPPPLAPPPAAPIPNGWVTTRSVPVQRDALLVFQRQFLVQEYHKGSHGTLVLSRIPQSGPLLPIPPPTQMANGTRPPPPQRLMVSPRGQGYKPGPPPVRLLLLSCLSSFHTTNRSMNVKSHQVRHVNASCCQSATTPLHVYKILNMYLLSQLSRLGTLGTLAGPKT